METVNLKDLHTPDIDVLPDLNNAGATHVLNAHSSFNSSLITFYLLFLYLNK